MVGLKHDDRTLAESSNIFYLLNHKINMIYRSKLKPNICSSKAFLLYRSLPLIAGFISSFLYIALIFLFKKSEYLFYIQAQLIAAPILIAIETPLLQHQLEGNDFNTSAFDLLRTKLIIGLIFLIIFISLSSGSFLFILLSLLIAPSTWQITHQNISYKGLVSICLCRILLLSIASKINNISVFILLFSFSALIIANIFTKGKKQYFKIKSYSITTSVKSIIKTIYDKKSFAIRPLLEAIIYSYTLSTIILNLPKSISPLIFIYFRSLAIGAAFIQLALLTNTVPYSILAFANKITIKNIILSTSSALCIVIFSLHIFPSVYIKFYNQIILIILFFSVLVVSISQYFSGYLLKQKNLLKADFISGILFAASMIAMALISYTTTSAVIIPLLYIAFEGLIIVVSIYYINVLKINSDLALPENKTNE